MEKEDGMAEKKEGLELMKAGEHGKPDGLTLRGMKITFKNVNYLVPSNVDKGKMAYLLSNVSGYLLPCQMAALMGPSGSGKTTLLDVLAGRKTAGTIQGEIAFAAHKPTLMFLRRFTGYVEQFDTLLDVFSVREMLMYTAELKRSVKEPISSKREAVDKLIKKLALEVCSETRIGSALHRGISGGQAKRVNIGIALITNPRVLFLDEPTSGLDSYTANEVMTVVKGLTVDGVTLCATIHSPSPYAFSLFDRVMMLVRGRVVYFGDRTRASPYFEAVAPETTGPSMSTENEAEWLTDVIVRADRNGQGPYLADKFAESEIKKEADAMLDQVSAEKTYIPSSTLSELAVKRATVTPFWAALKTLIKYRTARNYVTPAFLGPRIGDKLIFSILVMTLYVGIGDDLEPSNFFNIGGVLFMWCTLPAFGAASYVPSIVLERALFVRERNDGLYRVITYLCAKIIDELLIAVAASAVFGSIVFFPVKLQGSFALFWLIYFLTLANGIVLAYFVAAMSPNMEVANAALPTYVVILLFFAGFLLRPDDIPEYWFWFSKIDFLRYAWGALMKNQFEDDSINVLDDDGNEVEVLKFYDLEDIDKWKFAGIEFAFVCGFFVLALLALSYMKHTQR